MKFKIGDEVQFISDREETCMDMVGIIIHTKDKPGVESNILSGQQLYPLKDFHYTIVLRNASVQLILNVYENELRIQNF